MEKASQSKTIAENFAATGTESLIRPKRATPSSNELRLFGHPPVVPGEMPASRGPDRPADGTRTR
jgi:hypothetical protein